MLPIVTYLLSSSACISIQILKKRTQRNKEKKNPPPFSLFLPYSSSNTTYNVWTISDSYASHLPVLPSACYQNLSTSPARLFAGILTQHNPSGSRAQRPTWWLLCNLFIWPRCSPRRLCIPATAPHSHRPGVLWLAWSDSHPPCHNRGKNSPARRSRLRPAPGRRDSSRDASQSVWPGARY